VAQQTQQQALELQAQSAQAEISAKQTKAQADFIKASSNGGNQGV